MRQFLSTDFIVLDSGTSAGLLPAHLLREDPVRSRSMLALSLLAVALLALVDWKIEQVQLSVLALVPLAVFAWFAPSRLSYVLAVAMALVFTYFDYAGPQALLVNLPLDTVFTVISYLAMVAVVVSAGNSIRSALALREQLAISSETVSIQRWLADHDALTSAANRRAFRKAMMQAAAAASLDNAGFGIIVGDIDHFKEINTRYGQRTGDRLLCTLFSRAEALFGPDVTLGRLDGDEFAVMLPGVKTEWELFAAASKLAQELSVPYVVDGTAIELTVTLATAVFPSQAADTDMLLELAENKVYEAKRHKRKG